MWGGYLKCVCALVYLGDESSELQSRPRFYSNSFRVFTWDAPSICVLECPLFCVLGKPWSKLEFRLNFLAELDA